MSMKRSKQKSSGGAGRGSDDVASIFQKAPEKEKTYEELTAGQPDEAFVAYSPKLHLPKGTLINHPKFGKGGVVAVEGGAVVVAFADGKKKLGHTPQ
jgi:hypothetical protein